MESEAYFRNSGFIGRTSQDSIRYMYSKNDEIIDEDSDSSNSYKWEIRALLSIIRFKKEYYVFTKNRITKNKRNKIWHVINSQFQKSNFKGWMIQKGDYLRFGKIVYKVKYISTIPPSTDTKEKQKSKKAMRRQNLSKILPSSILDTPMLNNFDEENKMIQESAANNSALAATIDQLESSSRLRGVQNHHRVESKGK